MTDQSDSGTVEVVSIPEGYEVRIELGEDFASRLDAEEARALSLAVVDTACATERTALVFELVRTMNPSANVNELAAWSGTLLHRALGRYLFSPPALDLLPMVEPSTGNIAVGFARQGKSPSKQRLMGAFDTRTARRFALALLQASYECEHASALYRAARDAGLDEDKARTLVDEYGEDLNFWGDEREADA